MILIIEESDIKNNKEAQEYNIGSETKIIFLCKMIISIWSQLTMVKYDKVSSKRRALCYQ